MKRIQADGNTRSGPDAHSFSHVIVCLLRSGADDVSTKILQLFDEIKEVEKSMNSGALLNSALFETTLSGFSNPGTCDRDAAKLLLEKIISLSKENKIYTPTPKCLNLVLKAECMKSDKQDNKDAAETAHQLLFDWIRRYKSGEIDTLPDAVGCNTLINCWLNTRRNDKVSKAEQIFQAMEILSTKQHIDSLKPDMYTFTSMLKIYSKSKAHEEKKKAEAFIKKLQQSDVELDAHVLTGMLNVWANSIQPHKAVKARQLLDTMLSNNIAKVTNFNTVLTACTYTKGRSNIEKRALKIGLQTYNDLLESQTVNANDVSFAHAMNMVKRLLHDKEEQQQHLKRFFDDCCNHGVLSKNVLKQLQDAISEEEERFSLLEYDFKSPPKREWTSNL
jgi:hypothetical protein